MTDSTEIRAEFARRVAARNKGRAIPEKIRVDGGKVHDDGVRGGQGRDDNALRDGYVIVVGVLVTLMLVWSVVWVLAGDK